MMIIWVYIIKHSAFYETNLISEAKYHFLFWRFDQLNVLHQLNVDHLRVRVLSQREVCRTRPKIGRCLPNMRMQ